LRYFASMIKSATFLLCFLLATHALYSQVSPYTSNYRFNPYLLNPAFVGVDARIAAIASHATQFERIPGSPFSASLSGVGAVSNRVGLGTTGTADVSGNFLFTSWQIANSYKLKFKSTTISLGSAIHRVDIKSRNFPLMHFNQHEDGGWSGSVGAYMSGENYGIGLSASQAIVISGFDKYSPFQLWVIHGSYCFEIGKIAIEPSLWLIHYPNISFSNRPIADFLVQGHAFDKAAMVGVGYRSLWNHGSIMGGFRFMKHFQLLYCYDFLLKQPENPWNVWVYGQSQLSLVYSRKD
jgi:type IX secretion system PorP/SprF family membrane protein